MNKQKKIIISIIIWTVLLSPLLIYFYKFGGEIWEKVEGWSNFGTAMSGVYSPVIAFFAFLILIAQHLTQGKMNKHEYDNAFISRSLSDLDFYIDLLDKELDITTKSNNTNRQEIQSIFGHLDKDSIKDEKIKLFAQKFHSDNRKIFDIWASIYPLLMGLNSQNEYPYEHNFISRKQRLITILSFHTCVALDQYHSCISENRAMKEYFFWDKK